ncbi:tripartite motif-containing protein 40-like [Iris pallida]|uniref:Tripartite motif-containing protein 40-like n=1 Tax=Iris pallida TaxID=29817 RepID=A0AAX6FGV3_IRIPA|nr:tripartite motif-containing protein 40-like [Iris pallida]
MHFARSWWFSSARGFRLQCYGSDVQISKSLFDVHRFWKYREEMVEKGDPGCHSGGGCGHHCASYSRCSGVLWKVKETKRGHEGCNPRGKT